MPHVLISEGHVLIAIRTRAYCHKDACLLNRHVWRSQNPTMMKVVTKFRFFSDKQIYLSFFFEVREEKPTFVRENE